jgi:hypothetical protein
MLKWELSWDGALEKVPMFGRIGRNAPEILFLATASILIVSIAQLF